MRTLDFLIVGSQKAGTTSLFEYIRRHPEVYLPPEKEISFFDRRYARGHEWYLSTTLRKAPADAICGEASVGYMGGAPFGEITDAENWEHEIEDRYEYPCEEVIPRRIHELMPRVKLIAALRDPVDRAYSQYLMAVLTEAETRSFDEVVLELLEPEQLAKARAVPTDTNSYISYGEYARILRGYRSVFPSDQMLVVYSHDLSRSPEPVLAEIFRFIGAADDVTPANLDVHYRTAAVAPRVKGLNLHSWQALVARRPLARFLWHAAPSGMRTGVDRAYKLASFRMAVWNARRGTQQEKMSLATRRLLVDHFYPEADEISQMVGRDTPWRAAWDHSSGKAGV